MRSEEKPIVWLKSEIKTPPFSQEARIEAGTLLGRLQQGDSFGLPHNRPMPSIGKKCHELRITDENCIWRIIYRLDNDAIIIGEIFSKKDKKTPKPVIDLCKKRFKEYDKVTS